MSGDYRSVIIGASGGRARHHALAYRYQARARLVAVSARTAEPRDKLAADYGVAARLHETPAADAVWRTLPLRRPLRNPSNGDWRAGPVPSPLKGEG